jgi:hypothetical protein
MGNVCGCLVLCMVVPSSDALDTTVCVLDTLGCALYAGGGGKGCVFACLSFCPALFLCGFHWLSEGFAPWLRRVGRLADGSAVLVGIFGWVVWRDFGSLCLVVLRHVLSHGVFGFGIQGVRVVFGEFLGEISIFGEFCAEWAYVLAWVWERFSGAVGMVWLFCRR